MINVEKKDIIKGGRYSVIFAAIRSLLMEAFKSNMLSIEDFVEFDKALEEMESVLITIAKEAKA